MNDPWLLPPMGHSELADNEPLTLHTPTSSFETWSANGLLSPPNLRNAFRPRNQSNHLPFQYLSPPTTPTENVFRPANYILMLRISQSNHPPGEADSTILSSLGVVANASLPVPTLRGPFLSLSGMKTSHLWMRAMHFTHQAWAIFSHFETNLLLLLY